MCGIAGILASGTVTEQSVNRMTRPLLHRGPDDGGCWIDIEAGIGLGHRRLAIVDLTAAGHQPMHSTDGRYVLTYNGEIYNHQDIRTELEAAGAVPEGGWRGHSDTEVLLQAVVTWGLRAALERSVGMFALALWDRRERTLSLARDRFGEKPLYYGWAGKDLLFGSELKALTSHPKFDARIDRRAVGLFAARTYIPAPFSIYERTFKLQPGWILTLSRNAAARPLSAPPQDGVTADGLSLERYWSYGDVMLGGLDDPIEDETAAVDELERTLAAAIKGQSMADVPVGAFLSGGIDSSTVVGLYQKYSSIPVRTFSIGFEQAGFNEAEDAKRVAAHLGTVHQERYVTVAETRDVIPLLPTMYDEPFADSSQIPTYLVSRFAREQVTVALTGDGGDELFAGYNRHFAAPKMWEQLQRVPRPLRSATGSPLSRVPSQVWSGLSGLLPGRRQPHFGGKMQKAFRVAASAHSFDDVYCSFLDEWSFEPSPVIGASRGDNRFDLDLGRPVPDAVRMMYCDAVTYLPDDILAKVDRASMAVSLETRVPFLDHRVAELAARIPLSLKVRDGKGKHLVRQLLYGLVPRNLVERPKAGFGIPVGEWIKGPLRPWAEDLLSPAALKADGLLDAQVVRRRWADHLAGRRDSTPALWAVLMLQAWMREQSAATAAAA
ncbi:asparagine synthase (glutamine-hydrolyzing) [Sphingomonas sp. F9_3S_D5_B_2]